MTKSPGGQWEVLLADLSLILFITSLGALVSMPMGKETPQHKAAKVEGEVLEVAPSQALYRSVTGGPNLAQWLNSQPRDPRATLTIFVDYDSNNVGAQLLAATEMIAQAESVGVPVRTVLRPAQNGDIYASLAFDASS